jgi:lysyl-tRNA synthetase class II
MSTLEVSTVVDNSEPSIPEIYTSKKEIKRLAKLDAKKKAKATTDNGPVTETDFESRSKYIEKMRRKYPTLYQSPFPVTHSLWSGLIDDVFHQLNPDEYVSNHTDEEIVILGRVSSCRASGRIGFITLYFEPEKTKCGLILRPEIQVLLRSQEFRVANVIQEFATDSTFPGLNIPVFKIVEETFDSDEKSLESRINFIKALSRKDVRVFDQFYVVGYPGYSDTKERTIYAKYIFPASINYHMANRLHGVEEHGGSTISNVQLMYRKPFLRWLYDTKSLHVQHIRSAFRNEVERFLKSMNLMQVDVPHLLSIASGANAKPFTTYQNDGALTLSLRIAPEIELKMCVIGGLSPYGVYHYGAQFRNEGADSTHNPEFTSCEAYFVGKSFYELLKISENLVRTCCLRVLEKTQIITQEEYVAGEIKSESPTCSYFIKEDGSKFKIEWSKPFVNINFLEEINKNLTVGKLPNADDLYTDDANRVIKELAIIHNVSFKETDSIAKILDNMFDELVLPNTFMSNLPNSLFKTYDENGFLEVSPVTVFNHPKIMSPLAMEQINDGNPTGIVSRFESFVCGMEFCNAYQELSDPVVQSINFETQRKFQENGDDEAMSANDVFVEGLEYGMKPVAGWGIGVERMFMFLSGESTIKGVLPFPHMKPTTE